MVTAGKAAALGGLSASLLDIAHATLDTTIAGTLLVNIGDMKTDVDLVQTQRTTINTSDTNPLKCRHKNKNLLEILLNSVPPVHRIKAR